MVIVFQSRSSLDPTNDECSTLWELLTMSLLELLKEKTDRSLLMTWIFLKSIGINMILNVTTVGKKTTKSIRAVTEPLFTSHFGNSIIDMLFKKFEKKLADYLASKKTRHLCVVISLIKK
ncbi:putative jasmonate O-methyltransferase [Helianthus annuus]|nr:putative jasmonate O-methyltransferase [Helianthus annuus]